MLYSIHLSKDCLTTKAINKISTFRAEALRLEISNFRMAFARNVEILFIALVVRRSFDTFAVIYRSATRTSNG